MIFDALLSLPVFIHTKARDQVEGIFRFIVDSQYAGFDSGQHDDRAHDEVRDAFFVRIFTGNVEQVKQVVHLPSDDAILVVGFLDFLILQGQLFFYSLLVGDVPADQQVVS